VANYVAMAFGVTHALLDAFLIFAGVGVGLAVVVTILVVSWWRAGLRALGRATGSRLVIAGVWAGAVFTFLNGLTILACLPPCGGSFGIADIAHIGSLLSPFVAVFLTWQFVRHRAEPPVPARAQ
jgi:hypothetical protein